MGFGFRQVYSSLYPAVFLSFVRRNRVKVVARLTLCHARQSIGMVTRAPRFAEVFVSIQSCPSRGGCVVFVSAPVLVFSRLILATSRTVRRRGVVYSLFRYPARGGSCGVSVFHGDKEGQGGKTDVDILALGVGVVVSDATHPSLAWAVARTC